MKWAIGCTIGIVWFSLGVPAQAQLCPEVPSPPAPPPLTPNPTGAVPPSPVITIGRSMQSPFAVIVLSAQWDTLQAVRQCVATAFLSDSRLGKYIFAESFPDRASAERLMRILRSRGLDARVIYFR